MPYPTEYPVRRDPDAAASGAKIGELPVAALRALAQEHHLLVLRGFDSGFSDGEVLTRYAEQWGEIMMWPFGAVLT